MEYIFKIRRSLINICLFIIKCYLCIEFNSSFFQTNYEQFVMRKIKIRTDLMSKLDYSKKYNISRVTIDKMINEGMLSVEEISGKHYIKVSNS